MQRILTFPARSILSTVAVLLAWLAILVAGAPLGAQFEDVITNEPSSFLPGSSEAVTVAELAAEFPGGELTPAVVVSAREAGLTPDDRAAIEADRDAIAADPPESSLPPTPVDYSPDGVAAVYSVPLEVSGDAEGLQAAVDRIRAEVADGPAGLETDVTGPAGFSADAIEVFGDINTTLLLATASLVIVLLLIIYRSPIFWVLPILAVGFAELAVRSIGYLLGSNGVVINGQTQGILPCSSSGRAPTTRCCSSRVTGRNCTTTPRRARRCGSRCRRPGPRSSPVRAPWSPGCWSSAWRR